jgi:hypothetical protein
MIMIEVVEPATSATRLNANYLTRYICRYTPATGRYIRDGEGKDKPSGLLIL